MLTIDIIGGNLSDDSLVFEVSGNPNNGNTDARKNWKVEWNVDPNPANQVRYIRDIRMKTGPNAPSSTDIFSGDGQVPAGNGDRTKWSAKVKSNSADNVLYHYDILWVAKGENESNIRTHDPLITIKPTQPFEHLFEFIGKHIVGFVAGAVFSLLFLRHRKGYKKEVRDLKMRMKD